MNTDYDIFGENLFYDDYDYSSSSLFDNQDVSSRVNTYNGEVVINSNGISISGLQSNPADDNGNYFYTAPPVSDSFNIGIGSIIDSQLASAVRYSDSYIESVVTQYIEDKLKNNPEETEDTIIEEISSKVLRKLSSYKAIQSLNKVSPKMPEL